MPAVISDSSAALTVPSVSLKKLKFSGGDEIALAPGEKVLIVGANNSGKSKSIRETLEICSSDPGSNLTRLVVTDVEIEKRGSQEEFSRYVRGTGRVIGENFLIGSWLVSRHNLSFWSQQNLQAGLVFGFIRNITANERLSICELQNSIGLAEPASKPQHLLYRDSVLMEQISLLFKQAFGRELMIDYLGGSQIPIYVGTPPRGAEFVDRASTPYSAAVAANPALHEQGDGMKSYAGILFEAIASKRDVTLIDEPEAFLHPPQMRRLGETLAKHVTGQLIVATHSSDILRGFLEGRRGAIRVLRIKRTGDVNQVFEAPSSSIETLWNTPVLRFSNALEAIFHEQAILCEDDSDCRLLNAAADFIQGQTGHTWPDTAYIPLGGKANIAKVAKVLRDIGVPVKAVYDFDLIAESARLREAVEAFRGNWSEISVLWQRVSAAVVNAPRPTPSQIKDAVRSILDQARPDALPRSEVEEAFKQRNQWTAIKKHGLDGLPRGEVREHCGRLVELLKTWGIYLIPSGEMESFCPSVGGHGPRFVTEVLSRNKLGDSSMEPLRQFTEQVHLGPHVALHSVGTIAQQRQTVEEHERPPTEVLDAS